MTNGLGMPSERFEYLAGEIENAPEPRERVQLAGWDFRAGRVRSDDTELVTESKASTVMWIGLTLFTFVLLFYSCGGLFAI